MNNVDVEEGRIDERGIAVEIMVVLFSILGAAGNALVKILLETLNPRQLDIYILRSNIIRASNCQRLLTTIWHKCRYKMD